MIPEFDSLNDSEVELMLKAPILVCILIAGADGNIERKEIKDAITVSEEQGNLGSTGQYIEEVFQDFEDKVLIIKQSYSKDTRKRANEIIAELSGLNLVMTKLDPGFASRFYIMIKKLAQKIASSSGGILGINSIDAAEAKLVDLSMIDPPGDYQ